VSINERAGVAGLAEGVEACALAAGSRLSNDELRATVWRVLDPAAVLARASDAVARGNLKVFAEIAAVFARFNADCLRDATRDDAHIERFCDSLHAGEPPDGQDYLRAAFTHYYDALFTVDPKARAELLFLANIEVGFHEQTRLQPEIAAALDLAGLEPRDAADRLVAAIFPGATWITRIWQLLMRLLRGPTPLERAVAPLVTEIRRHLRQLLTEHFLTLGLANGVRLRLGRDLSAAFPASLERIANARLSELLLRIDPTADSLKGSGAVDWTDLAERLHFICDFFRCQHERSDLFMPPFSAEQAAALKAGSIPAGEL
jgi:hypothetical protein